VLIKPIIQIHTKTINRHLVQSVVYLRLGEDVVEIACYLNDIHSALICASLSNIAIRDEIALDPKIPLRILREIIWGNIDAESTIDGYGW